MSTAPASPDDRSAVLAPAPADPPPSPERETLSYAPASDARAYDPDDHDCAVASVACALFVCAPFLTGVMSRTFGVAVLRHARRLDNRDLVIAIVGTVLGFGNLGLWAALVLDPLRFG